MTTLIHCIYTSAATADFSAAQLTELLHKARVANAAVGITGMLLYSEGNFFQVLEGQASDVDACYARINLDRRHTKLTRIIREIISHRSFGEWTMGFANPERDALRAIEGLNDFFEGQTCFEQLDPGRAKKLLAAFALGRWRSTLSGPPSKGVPA